MTELSKKNKLPDRVIGVYCGDVNDSKMFSKLTATSDSVIVMLIPKLQSVESIKFLQSLQAIQVIPDQGPFPLECGGIYYTDPASFPEVSHGQLTFSHNESTIRLSPEDHFFKSIARHYGPYGSGIMIGGNAKIGISLIRGAGGVTLGTSSYLEKNPEMIDIVQITEHITGLNELIANRGEIFAADQIEMFKQRAETREKQQAVVAQLSLLALTGTDLNNLFQKALEQVVTTLNADYGKILKYQPDEKNFLLINGVGWEDGLVGTVTVPDSKDSQAGFTLLSEDTVIVNDIMEEKRFTGSPLFTDHEVVSGMSCVINHSPSAFGVFGVHTREARIFTQDDANFLLSVANMLSTAINYKHIQQQLFKSEEQFRTMANSIPQLAWMTDESGWIFWYNQRWFDFTGTTMDLMKGWGWTKVIHPDHKERVMMKFKRKIERGEIWEDTFPLKRYDDQYQWFLSRARPIRDENGNIIKWFGTNTDITQQRETEKALYESEEKLRIAKNAGNVGTFQYYLNVEKTEWDPMLKKLWGIPQDAEVTQEHFWACLHPDDIDHTRQAINKAVDPKGDGHYYCEYRVVNRQTGEISYVESSGQVIFNEGVSEKMIGLVIDITKRKKLENSLQNAIQELENSNSKKNEFLATLGHELRNPLASISGGIQLLQLENPDLDEIRIISNGVNQMSSLLDDLLDLTRIERGKIRLDMKPINLSSLFLSVSNSSKSMMESKAQNFLVKSTSGKLAVNGDETRIEQIISNLLTNANKFTPREGEIEISLSKNESGQAVINVRDNGVGLSEEMYDRIFNPFEQVDNAENRGLGIGLSLVKQFVEMHGGTILAKSEGIGKGCEFTVVLPLIEQKMIPENNCDNKEDSNLSRSLKILIVEDNADAARGLEALLKRAGCEVITTESGKDTMDILQTFTPEVFILDIGLPDIDGYDLIRKIKSIHNDKAIYIAHTGYGHESAQFKSKVAGFDFHLNKPVKLNDLMSILNKV